MRGIKYIYPERLNQFFSAGNILLTKLLSHDKFIYFSTHSGNIFMRVQIALLTCILGQSTEYCERCEPSNIPNYSVVTGIGHLFRESSIKRENNPFGCR